MHQGKAVFESVTFKKGSYIVLEGQAELDRFYILKTGSAERCISRFFLNNSAIRECRMLEPGDLFGVISFLSKRPRMESVLALNDTVVYVVQKDIFGKFIQDHTDLALKIIRYFSKQLRHYDSIAASLSSKSPPEILIPQNIENLYTTGNYYWGKKKYHMAGYAFARYLEYGAVGRRAERAKGLLAKIRSSKTGMFPLEPKKSDHLRSYMTNQPIFMEGEHGEELYVIQSGSVRITKVHNGQEILLNVLPLGEIFGEMALIENKTRNSNAVAADDVKLLAINRDNFEYIVQNYPAMVIRIFEILAERLWLVYYQIANLFLTDPEIKIYDALHIQILKHRIQVSKNVPCTLHFTVKDILKFTGMDDEEGEAAIASILENNSNIYINPDGKICCMDVSDIIQRLNVIKRDSEVEKNILSSEYSTLLHKDAK
ncbi:MAG: cyclic nucleotide-binding domain-containing protein [Spirochaetes bacterium]|nr:MAG: cyclic nucleotide-binding domain-containing protein [Spirochaetota bacterium]